MAQTMLLNGRTVPLTAPAGLGATRLVPQVRAAGFDLPWTVRCSELVDPCLNVRLRVRIGPPSATAR